METTKNLTNKEEQKSKEMSELTYDLPVFVPVTDIYEKDDKIYVVCDMPGVNENNIDIHLENNELSITGQQEPENYENYELINRGYLSGIFKRSFTLSPEIDSENIGAKIKNGVLTIELNKAESAKPKKITVTCE